MKKHYEKLSIVPLAVEPVEGFLAASVSGHKIRMRKQDVTVDDFDSGFGSKSDNFSKEISFD